MKFIKYSSIEGAWSQKFINYIETYGLTGGEWCVTEKVHGSNFQVAYDGTMFYFGKRSKWIGTIENFFGNCWVPLVSGWMFKKKIEDLYNKLNANTLVLYGELFGGYYEHPDVPAVQNATRIQKGVDYCPDNKIYIFDIKVDGEFINHRDLEYYCETCGFFYAKILFSGSFSECMNYPNDFQTTIPARLGLPPIDGNICEGIVIKPLEAKFLPSGSRAILKSKNEKFADKLQIPKTPKKFEKLSEKGNLFQTELISFITMARLDSAMSKEGNLKKQDFGKVLNLVWVDILEDFRKENGSVFDNIEKTERILITKVVRTRIADTIRTEFFSRV